MRLLLPQNARNQLWFFEPADVKESGTDPTDPPAYESSTDTRYPEITDGNYTLTMSSNPARYMYPATDPLRVGYTDNSVSSFCTTLPHHTNRLSNKVSRGSKLPYQFQLCQLSNPCIHDEIPNGRCCGPLAVW